MLAKRILTAIIGIPLLTILVFWGSRITFLVVIMLCASFGLSEFYRMALPKNNRLTMAIAIAAGLFGVWMIYYYQGYISFKNPNELTRYVTWSMAIVTLAVFIFLLINFIYYPKKVITLTKPLTLLIGIFYVCLFLSYFMLIRCSADGRKWVLFTLFVVWFGDSGAYFIGRLMGKRKLSHVASPQKTVEGALGCLAASLIAVFATKNWFLKQLTVTDCVVLALGIAVIGQLGDLCESTLKRINGVKDSGNLLPGHGGMLDRIDSLLFVAPLVYYYKMVFL